jgi:hypothetical protein
LYRNAAKARTRDVPGRLQKGFFGRQRISALISDLKRSSTPENTRSKLRQDIELAHARRNICKEALLNEDAVVESRDANNIEQRSSSSSGSSSTDSTKHSRTLDALDASERKFLEYMHFSY